MLASRREVDDAGAQGFLQRRREVPVWTFADWNQPPLRYCEVDLVAHGGASVSGTFIQTLTMADVATGWTECFPLLVREGALVVQAIKAQSLFPWLILGLDFDNDSAFMKEAVCPGAGAAGSKPPVRGPVRKTNAEAFSL